MINKTSTETLSCEHDFKYFGIAVNVCSASLVSSLQVQYIQYICYEILKGWYLLFNQEQFIVTFLISQTVLGFVLFCLIFIPAMPRKGI